MLLKIVLGGEMWNYFNKLVRDMKLFQQIENVPFGNLVSGLAIHNLIRGKQKKPELFSRNRRPSQPLVGHQKCCTMKD